MAFYIPPQIPLGLDLPHLRLWSLLKELRKPRIQESIVVSMVTSGNRSFQWDQQSLLKWQPLLIQSSFHSSSRDHLGTFPDLIRGTLSSTRSKDLLSAYSAKGIPPSTIFQRRAINYKLVKPTNFQDFRLYKIKTGHLDPDTIFVKLGLGIESKSLATRSDIEFNAYMLGRFTFHPTGGNRRGRYYHDT